MINEDILTALKNAVDHGESLENAINIMINSGYPPYDVYEAAKFVGNIPLQRQITPENELLMPAKKSLFPNIFKKEKTYPQIQPPIPLTRQVQPPPPPPLTKQIPAQQPTYLQHPYPRQDIQKPQFLQQQYPEEPTPQIPPSYYQEQKFLQAPRPEQSLTKQLSKIGPAREGRTKEIVLLIILLILIAILIGTIVFKDKILALFVG